MDRPIAATAKAVTKALFPVRYRRIRQRSETGSSPLFVRYTAPPGPPLQNTAASAPTRRARLAWPNAPSTRLIVTNTDRGLRRPVRRADAAALVNVPLADPAPSTRQQRIRDIEQALCADGGRIWHTGGNELMVVDHRILNAPPNRCTAARSNTSVGPTLTNREVPRFTLASPMMLPSARWPNIGRVSMFVFRPVMKPREPSGSEE